MLESTDYLCVKFCGRVMLACILLLAFCTMPAVSAFSQNESLPENIERNPAELQPTPTPQPVKPKPRPAYIPDASEWKHDDDETLTPSDLDKGHETFLLAP